MLTIINIIEVIIGLAAAIWFYLLLTGKLNYPEDRERKRQEGVKKYGWLLKIAIFCCLGGSLLLLISIFE